MKLQIKPWEVWYARVRYEDAPAVKMRPVVVTSAGTVWVLALKVTSHAPRREWGEYALREWAYAGLTKPSTVRISKQLRLEERDMARRIGELHVWDIMNIQMIMAQKGA